MERREWTPKTAFVIVFICACLTSIATAFFQWFGFDPFILWLLFLVMAVAIFQNTKFPPKNSGNQNPPPAI